MEPIPLQSRPADQRMTQGHPEARPDRSQEPNCSNSFIRDQIKDPDPTGGPILKEYQTANQSWLRSDRVWETTHSTRRVIPSRSN